MEDYGYPVIGFGLEYGSRLIYCEAVMKDGHYDVLFDGKWMASIAYNDHWDWMLDSGMILPEETIAEIGLRIESHYQ
ncbi:hypothetical protein [Mucilaginibacter ginsenosidivorax]|uniref:Uncharacterized protein n=1 Tax=Mucilaginibacter ginsenosidivorax TaxID=862126 RepID=A0A5B8VTF4_9SPHI|nr:hypothetical protein [Mucilaginibacter ginsenosidivorax]QEC74719.1 hypothetical protein FSB76_01680 [Mucilaginibacter ginsenosidivorax]